MTTAKELSNMVNEAREARQRKELEMTDKLLEERLALCANAAKKEAYSTEIFAPWSVNNIDINIGYFENRLKELGFQILSNRRIENLKLDMFGIIYRISWDV